MNTFIALIVLVAAVAVIALLVAELVAAVRGDGYGRRPAPRSHHHDTFAGGRPHAL
jgi:hypothetical protein